LDSIITIPLLAVGAFFGVSYFVSPSTIVIQGLSVPKQIEEEQGYNSDVVSGLLSNALARIADTAGTNRGNYVSEGSAQAQSVEALSDWFGLAQPIRATQVALGFLPYAFSGEFIQEGDDLILRINGESSKYWHFEMERRRSDGNVQALIHETALGLLQEIDPYVVAVYHFRREIPTKDFTLTKHAIDHALVHSPRKNLPWVYALLAHVLSLEGDYEGSILKNRQALALDPAFPRPMMRWGENLAIMGRHDEAIGRFKKVLEIEPKYPEALVFWAKSLIAKGDLKGAHAKYREAYEMDPNFDRTVHAYGIFLSEHGDKVLAADLLRRAVTLGNGHNEKYIADLRRVQREVDPVIESTMPFAAPKPGAVE
jgi:tetratricopeptide (TPR) repeat protein